MKVQKRTLNWFPKQSAWNEAQARRAKQRAANNAFSQQQAAVANTFQNVRDNLTFGMAENAARAAATRVQAGARASLSKLA